MGIQEVNSAGQIDQLNALRFKMQSGKFNLSRSKSEKFRKMKCRVCGMKFRKKESTTNMGALLVELEVGLLGNMEHSREVFLGNPGWVLN